MRIGHHILFTTLGAALGGVVVGWGLWVSYGEFNRQADSLAARVGLARSVELATGSAHQATLSIDVLAARIESLAAERLEQELIALRGSLALVDLALGGLQTERLGQHAGVALAEARAAQLDLALDLEAAGSGALTPTAALAQMLGGCRALDEAVERLSLASHGLGGDMEAELEIARRDFESGAMVWLGGYAVMILGLGLFSSRRLVGPLSALSRAAESAHGEGGEIAQFHGGLEEVRRLSESLSNFSKRLSQNREDLERKVVERTQELEHANAAKSEFLAHMSHELRTPLSAIIGFGELLHERVHLQPEASEYAKQIVSNGNHLLVLLNDILDLSKIEAGQMTFERCSVSPRQLCEEVLSLFDVRAAAAGIALALEVSSDVPVEIASDPTRLRQVLVNLVGNAVKFTKSGTVTLRLMAPLDAVDGQRLAIEVEDSGIGIPANKLETIFEPFAQADNSTTRRFGGTGLGLAIARRLARGLGGDLVVESVVGQGSTFRLEVAATPAEPGLAPPGGEPVDLLASAPALSPALPAPATTKKFAGRALLVDDVPVNRRLIGILLERTGLTVECAENGLEAVQKVLGLLALGEPYDVVFMDMQMPVLDGYGAVQELRRGGYSLPIVALTAHAMAGDRERCLEAGCDGYLTKPVDRTALAQILELMLSNQVQSPAKSA